MGIRISEMEEATTFGADDYVPIVTNGTNKKALGQKIKDFIAGFFATKTGDNISDKATFRSAIEISATNTPFDKTGTGMSAENVQAGIVELSGNRALIDGSNISNPSAFRSAIGASPYVGSTVTQIDNQFTSGTAKEVTIPEDGWYYVVATTGGTSGDCTAFIYTDMTLTTFISASSAPSGTYKRTTTPLIPFKQGTKITIRLFFNNYGALYKIS